MPKKLTYEFVKSKFEDKGCKLLSLEYIDNRQPLEYLSPFGDKFETTWLSWQQGKMAHNDSKLKIPTIAEIAELFKSDGYLLLSTEYINSKTKLDYICPKGHTNSMVWSYWKSGHRCPTCAIEDTRRRPNHYKYDFEDVKLSGVIYKATNTINGKVYIGQTVCDFHKRQIKHFSKANAEKPSMHFHKALKKYGKDVFIWEIIEQCQSKQELDDMEFHYIKQYDSFKNGYNMTLGGEGTIGRVCDASVRLKISNSKKGTLASEETRAKLSRMHRGKTKLEAHVKNVANSVSRYWEITYPDGNIITIRNLEEFCRNNNLLPSGLAHVAYGRRAHYKGFKCRKIGKTLEV